MTMGIGICITDKMVLTYNTYYMLVRSLIYLLSYHFSDVSIHHRALV